MLSHLDPDFVPLLDEVRSSLGRLFRADDKALTIATSGTGTSAMEAAVANTVSDGMTALVVVTGYFGDRLAQIFERYGATRPARRRGVGPRVRPAAASRRTAPRGRGRAWRSCTPKRPPAC